MNKNDISVTIKSQSGGIWGDAVFNVHQLVRHVLDKGLEYFHLNTGVAYEILLVRGTEQRSLPLDQSLENDGVQTGDLLLIRTIGRTVDGAFSGA